MQRRHETEEEAWAHTCLDEPTIQLDKELSKVMKDKYEMISVNAKEYENLKDENKNLKECMEQLKICARCHNFNDGIGCEICIVKEYYKRKDNV